MASPFKFFRKNQKAALAALTIIAMGGFVVLPTVLQMMGTGNRAAAEQVVVTTERYGSLDRMDLARLRQNRQAILQFLSRVGRLVQMKQDRRTPSQAQQLAQSLGVEDEDLVETWVLVRRAEELGVVINDAAVNSFIEQVTEGAVSQAELIGTGGPDRGLLGDIGLPESELFRLLKYELKALRLQGLVGTSFAPTPPGQRWDYYQRLNRNMSVELVEVPVERFTSAVPDPDEATLQEFFGKYKEKENVPQSPEPGFLEPKRIAVEYFKVDYDHLFEPGELEEYYEENKEEFKRESLPKAEPADPAPGLEGSLPGFDGPELELPAGDETVPEMTEKPGSESAPAKPEAPTPKKSESEEPKEDTPEPRPAEPDQPEDEASTEKPGEKPGSAEQSRTERKSPFRLTAYQAEKKDDKPETESPAEPSEDSKPAESESDSTSSEEAAEKNEPESADDKPAQKETSGQEPEAQKPAEKKPTEKKPAAEKPAEKKPAAEKTVPEESAEKTPSEERPVADESAGKEPVEVKPAMEKPREETPAEEKPAAEKPAVEKPGEAKESAEEKPPAEKPAEQQPAAEKPAEKEKMPAEETPAAEAPAEKKTEPVSEYYSFEEVKSQIQSRLAPEKIEKLFRPLENEMELYHRKQIRYIREMDEAGDSAGEPPERPDFAKLAAEAGIEAKKTELFSQREAVERDLDIADANVNVGDQTAPFLRYAFESLPEFRANRAQDTEGNYYLFWKTQQEAERVPELGDPGVRERVVNAWKMIQAREEALAMAKSLAEEARSAQKASEEPVPLREVVGDEEGMTAKTTEPFTWYDPVSIQLTMMGYGRPRLGTVELSTPEKQDGEPGEQDDGGEVVPLLGKDFMQAASSLDQGEFGVAWNEPKTVAYVVRMEESTPDAQELRSLFLSSADPRQLQIVASIDRAGAFRDWMESLKASVGLEWQQ